MSDPDEQLFYDFKNSKFEQIDASEEMEYQMALIKSEKRTSWKIGSRLDEFVQKSKKRREERDEKIRKFLLKFAHKKEELKPLSDDILLNSE